MASSSKYSANDFKIRTAIKAVEIWFFYKTKNLEYYLDKFELLSDSYTFPIDQNILAKSK